MFVLVTWIRISNTRSLGLWYIKGTDEPVTVMDSLVPLMQHDLSDLGSLILIQVTLNKCPLSIHNLWS